MKFLVLTADYPPIRGGISTLTTQFVSQLSKLGHECVVLAPKLSSNNLCDDMGYKVVRYPGYYWGWLRILGMLGFALKYFRWADVIVGINISTGGVIAFLVKLILGKPYLLFGYAYEFLKFEHVMLVRILLRSIYNRAILVVAISDFTRNNLLKFGVKQENVIKVCPGANIPPFLSEYELTRIKQKYVDTLGPIVLSVGRFVPRKGHRYLIEAFAKVLQICPNAALVMVGDGPELDTCVKLANRLGIRDHIVFPGALEDHEVDALYQICDVFVLATGEGQGGDVEGFGLVFTEASACGKPVIGGRSGGVEEAILHGETGLLVEARDINSLANQIVRLLTDDTLAKRLGEQGRRRVINELNWTYFTQRILVELEKRL